MKGKEAIINSIISDAEAQAVAIKAEAAAKAKEITSAAADEAKKSAAEVGRKAKENTVLAEKRKTAAASSEVSKYFLSLKQGLMDECFSMALKKLRNLDNDKYLSLVAALLKEAEGGEKIIISRKDKGLITEKFVSGILKGKKFTLSAEGDFAGGVILSSDKYHINLTLEALLADMREDAAREVADILFGEK